jgi:hypothetical protein
MSPESLPVLISIHDVMPRTLGKVQRILDLMAECGLPAPALLVVPGLDWRGADIATLRAWQAAGCELAGHGWTHEVPHVRGLHHRVYSALISRRCAEHLALDADAIYGLLRRNHAWFGDHGLPAPRLYVPPAWALGSISRQRLAELPFRWYETLTGLYDVAGGSFRYLPVVGFEADTQGRVMGLRALNGLNMLAGRMLRRPVRVAIHPDDLDLLAAGDLRQLLRQALAPRSLESCAPPAAAPG